MGSTSPLIRTSPTRLGCSWPTRTSKACRTWWSSLTIESGSATILVVTHGEVAADGQSAIATTDFTGSVVAGFRAESLPGPVVVSVRAAAAARPATIAARRGEAVHLVRRAGGVCTGSHSEHRRRHHRHGGRWRSERHLWIGIIDNQATRPHADVIPRVAWDGSVAGR